MGPNRIPRVVAAEGSEIGAPVTFALQSGRAYWDVASYLLTIRFLRILRILELADHLSTVAPAEVPGRP
jgi:hypothetical protein